MAAPALFAAYSQAISRPAWPDELTARRTTSGNVAPIAKAGSRTTMSAVTKRVTANAGPPASPYAQPNRG